MHLIEWLRQSEEFPKLYLRTKEKMEYAALGTAMEGNVRVGGMAFFPYAPEKDALWSEFPRQIFWTPKFFKEQQDTADIDPAFIPACLTGVSVPDEDTWPSLIESALREIQVGSIEKVVLARRSSLPIQVDPYILLDKLKKKAKGAALFAVQFSPDATFIGATPERLYRRKGSQIWIDALAGTFQAGKEGLKECEKNLREFAFVKRSIEETIAHLCEKWQWEGEDRIHQTASVQHLYNCFCATLFPHATDEALLKALHPTAALGGTPRKAALQFIQDHEPFERGWYASPLGYYSANEAEFVVGIRSALVMKDAIHLFAGTGIVEGSIAANEWKELDYKMQLMMSIL